jgi:hypothetical protein
MWVLILCFVVTAVLTLFFLRAWVGANHEIFKDVADGVQSVCLAVAVLVGAVWTLYTFNTLGAQEQAQLQLSKLQGEVAKSHADLAKQAVLDIDIQASQKHISAPSAGRVISGMVTITNRGTRNTPIDWNNNLPQLVAVPLSFAQSGRPVAGAKHPIATTLVNGNQQQLVLIGQTIHLPFAISLPGPGLYYLEFQTNVSAEEQRGPNSIWVGRTVVTVD